VVSLLSQSQLHLDPRAQDLARPFLEADEDLSLDDIPAPAGGDLRVYQEAIESAGYEIYFADVTTPDVAHTGLAVTRVVVPGLVPNFPAAFPFLGQDAIQRCAVKLGWRSSVPLASELNYVPLPHA
jgi:ribosomal protein S12 methylthiotransferase accessory factor